MRDNRDIEFCEVSLINREAVEAVRRLMQPEQTFQVLAETFKALGDTTRVKIIFALSHKELCVCDLANLLGMSVSAVSHQLRILRNMRILKYRKEGKTVYYSLDDAHIKNIFNECLRHVNE